MKRVDAETAQGILHAETKQDACALCGTNQQLTFHHLIPRICHKNKWFRKRFEKVDMQQRGIQVCRRCHSFIHKQFTEKVLGRELNTLDSLLANKRIAAYIKWARKQR